MEGASLSVVAPLVCWWDMGMGVEIKVELILECQNVIAKRHNFF